MSYQTDGTAEAAANAALVTEFYTNFQQKNSVGMCNCYHDSVHFYDPVFEDLHGIRAKSMWRMLCERGKDLTIEFRIISADKNRVVGHWDARYTFSATKRPVLNQVDCTFLFRDGKIIDHHDSFDLWKWERQALGGFAALCGCCFFVKSKVRSTSQRALSQYMKENGIADASAASTTTADVNRV
eukprot:EC716135.1.p1 GENE.EC716135.1~~EC716135.1.p1  ORF type:complete len:184 (+),score=23.67 EC716135.1:33-584(+)